MKKTMYIVYSVLIAILFMTACGTVESPVILQPSLLGKYNILYIGTNQQLVDTLQAKGASIRRQMNTESIEQNDIIIIDNDSVTNEQYAMGRKCSLIDVTIPKLSNTFFSDKNLMKRSLHRIRTSSSI
jgi:hypothetical protein